MTFTIYTYPNNPRVFKAAIAAKYAGVELSQPEFAMGTANKTPEYLAKFPTGQVPALEADNVNLVESDAIAFYVASQGDGKLLGATKEQAAEVMQWMLMALNHLETPLMQWLMPLFGYGTYSDATYNKAVQGTKAGLELLDKVLLNKTYLVGESITLADIAVSMVLYSGLTNVLSPEHTGPYKNVMRYANTLFAQPEFKSVLGEVNYVKEEKKYTPPKEAPAAEAAKPAGKVKSALDLLPPSSFNLEEWKRFYSNNDTKPDAMNWFWEKFDAEGFSIWRVDYKYNDELTMVFMSSNLIGGFYARLERARKYAFGVLNVYGTNNANRIGGYFVLRGQEIPEEVTFAADFESYNFTKVENLQDEAFRADLADVFAWEGAHEGAEFADGKVFK